MRKDLPPSFKGVIAFGYPLVHPTQHRERKFAGLLKEDRLLFISGTKDAFMNFKLLGQAIERSPAQSNVIRILGGDHGLKCSKLLEEECNAFICTSIVEFLSQNVSCE